MIPRRRSRAGDNDLEEREGAIQRVLREIAPGRILRRQRRRRGQESPEDDDDEDREGGYRGVE